MSPRHLILVAALALSSQLPPVTLALAQVPPSNMRSGTVAGSGGLQTLNLFAVPGGMSFVLTDFMWSPDLINIDALRLSMAVRSGGTDRWRWVAGLLNLSQNTYNLPVQEHWTTGIVFNSGETVSFNIGDLNVLTPWYVSWSGYLAAGAAAAGEESPPAAPATLGQNVPNPFNPVTEIRYTLAAPGRADLSIYDAQGRLVRRLVQGFAAAGEHAVRWDGRNEAGEPAASGVYYYALDTGAGTEGRKAVLLK